MARRRPARAEAAFAALCAKMLSLVRQFCRGASREVSLVLLGLLPAAVLQGPAAGGGDEEGGGEGGGEVLCLLMEAALQAHLTHAGLDAAESSAGPPLELVSAPLA